MKKYLSIVLIVIMLLSAITVASEEKAITVFVDGTEIAFDVAPQIINGRTMVPLRAVFEELNATVEWDESTKTIKSSRGIINIRITIGEDVMYKNSVPVKLDCPAQIVNDRTLVPLRAIAEAFECHVEWVAADRSVLITSSEIITAQGKAWEKAKAHIIDTHDGEYEVYTKGGIGVIMYNAYTDSVMMRYARDDSDVYICNAIVNFYKDTDKIRVCVLYSPTPGATLCDAELYINKTDVVRGMNIKFEDETVLIGNLELMSSFMTECLPDMLDAMSEYFSAVDVSVNELGLVNYR
ncbi:MAG: copper amine oxidase N-terminal domain-containing protein [Clostridia bacterium]|nr:copper amine oxidase N-terminal domain-containing protein [Clostridia bacterium]